MLTSKPETGVTEAQFNAFIAVAWMALRATACAELAQAFKAHQRETRAARAAERPDPESITRHV
jgi:hypothetical protein